MNAKNDRETLKGVRRDSRPVFPGIVADARRLGVSRMHLWSVLSGRRESTGLVRRYHALKGGVR
jgi:hypothetical protein